MINMCLVGMVLLIVFTVVCINTYQNDMQEVEGALNMAIDNTREDKPAPFEIGTPPEGKKMIPVENGFKGKPFNYAAVVISIEDVAGEKRITVLNKEKYDANKNNLPSDFSEIILEGGCHAYFGMYGAQEGDGIPSITNEEQIKITAKAIVDIMK